MSDESPSEEDVRKAVKERYSRLAVKEMPCCGAEPAASPCCRGLYSEGEAASLPAESRIVSAGCGNPTAIADLEEGAVVVDLGSGGGIDAFLSSKKVGPRGRVYGIDATPEMIDRATRTAKANGYENVEFRLGQNEDIPLESNVADVVISNCVINLSPDKARVFREAFRILKPGGKIAVSDMVLLRPLPPELKKDMVAWSACLSGALLKDDYIGSIKAAGFERVEVVSEVVYPEEQLRSGISDPDSSVDLSSLAASCGIVAFKPVG
jgi:arsenite methyltransferase